MKIKIVPVNKEIEVNPNKTLLQLCFDNHIEIKSICKGIPNCAECRVKIVSGDHNVNPPSKAELNLIGSSYYLDGRRLACQMRCFGEITIDISEQIERSENQTKKIRGFKVQNQKGGESRAVQGTLILEEAEKAKK